MAEWKRFEEAVGAFLAALDPSAHVRTDVSLPDKHTGFPRQRDVWIATSYGGHIPITIFVSCKREKDRLDQQALDAFLGELNSSGAHVGVLYSYSGFTKPALAKAAVVGVSCCTLYEDRAPDLPEVLLFSGYCSTENVRLLVGGNPGDTHKTMSSLFELPATTEPNSVSAIDELVDLYKANGGAAMAAWHDVKNHNLPTWSAETMIEHPSLAGPIAFQLQSGWTRYRAKVDSWRINGSYSFASKDFKGSVVSPSVDRLGGHPGPGWELIGDDDMVLGNMFHFVLYNGHAKEGLLDKFGAEDPLVVFGNAIKRAENQSD